MTEPRVIKRYPNRKLYDTADSRYVTLDQIGEMIRSGEEVRIVDNATKDDLTNVTLAQIIFEEEKRKKRFLPLGTLKTILQSKGEQIQELARSLKMGAGKIIRSPKDKESEPPKDNGVPPEAQDAPPTPEEKTFIQNFLDGSQRTLDDIQRRIDERIKAALHSLTVPLSALQRELGELSRRLEALEKRLTDPSREEGRGKKEERKEGKEERAGEEEQE